MSTNLPDVLINIVDGGTGASLASNAGTQLKIGVSAHGATGVIAGFGSITALSQALGSGPLAESAAHLLGIPNAGPVYVLPTYPSTFGTVGAVTQNGPGAGSVAASLAPDQTIAMKVVLGGTLATATVQFSINGGAYGTPILTSASPAPVPGTLTKLTLPAGTYVAGDIYLFNTDGTKSLTGSGPAASGITVTSRPLDQYDVIVTISAAGGLGVGQFTYSQDGGITTSASYLIPSGGIFPVPGTGVVLTFSGTYVAGTTYSLSTVAPSLTTGDVAGAMDLANATSLIDWSIIHVVGRPTTAANAATLASTVDTKLTVAQAGYRYGRGVVECPHDADISGSNTDAAAQSAFAAFSSLRTMVCIGDARIVSVLPGGRYLRRSCAHPVTARISSVSPGTDIAATRLGPLSFITKIYRDESVYQTLDLARFTTLRTYTGQIGYYITNGRLMAPVGSDFAYLVAGRVMDAACRVARQALFGYINDDLEVGPDGKIRGKKADEIEKFVKAKLEAALITSNGGAGDASAVGVFVDRTANIISTGILPVEIKITPKGYARQISTTIGFTNPAIQAAA